MIRYKPLKASKSQGIHVAIVFLLLHSALDRTVHGNVPEEGLVFVSDCTCPRSNVIYECTVLGSEGFTVWQGTALSCTGNEITLVHRRFTSDEGAFGECNDGSIVGRSVRVQDGYYTSQLNVTVTSFVLGKSIRCLHDATPSPVMIGSSTINVTTVAFPPPNQMYIQFADFGSRQLTFRWSPVTTDCSALKYNILESNCGSCPTTTTNTIVTCTDVPTNGTVCTFAVQTVVCGDIVGNMSNPVSVSLSPSIGTVNKCGNVVTTSHTHTGVIVSATVFAVILVVCITVFTTVIIFLIKTKTRLQAELAGYRTSMTQNYDDVVHFSKPESAAVDTRKNIAYSVHTPKL